LRERGRSPTEPGSEGVNPIKSFVEACRQPVSDQLAGKSEAMCLAPACQQPYDLPHLHAQYRPLGRGFFRTRATARISKRCLSRSAPPLRQENNPVSRLE